MNKSTGIILGIMGAILAGFISFSIIHKSNNSIDISRLDVNSIIESTELSGGIPEHIEGNKDKAKVVIFEYSDYQCSGCASVVDDVAELLKKYGDDLAIVHRTYVLSYHDNGRAAASAVEAAGLQGYWKEYGDYLFANQSDWYYSDSTTRTDQFREYFSVVTKGKGDVDKFMSDFAGENVKAKVDFDLALAKKISDKIEYTPAFFLDGKFIDWAYDNEEKLSLTDYFSKIIDAKLK